MTGLCAKTRVQAVIVATDGRRFVGENSVANPQEICPRLDGEGYEKCKSVCRQDSHAEIAALALAGEAARGATVWLRGNHYFCDDCTAALKNAGVECFIIPADQTIYD